MLQLWFGQETGKADVLIHLCLISPANSVLLVTGRTNDSTQECVSLRTSRLATATWLERQATMPTR
jgi:hypothetical protein